MAPYLYLGPLMLQLPGLALLVGIWLALALIRKEAVRSQMSAATLENLVVIGLLTGIIGARLAYAVRFWEVYLHNPWGLFSLNSATLSAFEGYLIGIFAAILYGWRKKLAMKPALDVLAPGGAILMVFMGIAHLLSGEAFGAVAQVPWAIQLWGAARHPSQIYEILAALAIFLIVLRRPFQVKAPGLNFWLWLALSAFARVFLEAFRGDSQLLAGGIRSAQINATAILAIALFVIDAWSRSERSHE